MHCFWKFQLQWVKSSRKCSRKSRGKASDIYGTRYDRGKSSECLQDLKCWSDLKCLVRAGYDGYGPYDALEAEATAMLEADTSTR